VKVNCFVETMIAVYRGLYQVSLLTPVKGYPRS